jgi:glycerate dehydrogenase
VEHIVFLDRRTCPVEFRAPLMKHVWQDHDQTAAEQVAERLQDASVAITNKVPLREPQLRSLRALRLIIVAATGVDNVDLDYCRQNGITVCNVPHYARHSVAEHVFMLILALRRNLINYRADMENGLWPKSPLFSLFDHPIRGLAGCTLGIIGYGEIGQSVEKAAHGFEMKVLIAERKHAVEPRPGRTPFEQVLRDSDVISLHTPLTPATRQLIGSPELTAMRPDALLINTARGALIDELALAHALRSGLIGGAGLDVLSEEPPPRDHPLLAIKRPNLIVTPHNAWASQQALAVMAETVISNIEGFVAGNPRNVIH